MTIQEFKTHIEEELRHKLKGENEATPILDRLDKHLTDFDGYDLTDLLNPKNMKHDLYVSFLFQICFPSRIKMEIDAEYTPIKKKRIAIVSCKSRKQDYVCSADEMYSISHHYKAQKEFFIKGYDDFYIVSSEYGIIHPTQIIEPYNRAIKVSWLNASKDHFIGGYKEGMIELITKQIQWMRSKGWEIDFHTSMAYFTPLPQEIRDEIRYIKQPKGINSIAPIYREAINLLDNKPLEECLEFISEKKEKAHKDEEDTWFYHPIHGKYFGKSFDLSKTYPDTNQGGLFRVAVGIFKSHKGWVIDKSLLNQLHQTDSGQWRLKK